MVLQSPLKIQVLVSSLNKDVRALIEKMNIETDAIIVNQCERYDYEEYPPIGHEDRKVQCFSMVERGVGLSRNTALMHAEADICLFSDEDIVYDKGYEVLIEKAYKQHPDADIIIFNLQAVQSRVTYWNERVKRVRWYNYGRYPAYSISGKLDSFRRSNVYFSQLFGGGAKYSNGEDSLFLRDCLKAGLKIYALPVCIGNEVERPSTWFRGFTRKFFTDRGVLYYYLYGKMAPLLALRFLLKNKETMCRDIPFRTAYRMMKDGIGSQKNINK